MNKENKSVAPVATDAAPVKKSTNYRRKHSNKPKVVSVQEIQAPIEVAPIKKLTWFQRTFPKFSVWLNK